MEDSAPGGGSGWGRPQRILVTDGETRTALACVRALAARGHRVHVASATSRCLAGASRFAAGTEVAGDPAVSPERYAERLEQIAGRLGVERILPVTEATLGSVYAFRLHERLPVVCPEPAAYEAAVDKHALLERAARLGLAVPHTQLVEDPGALAKLPDAFRFPVVVKARRSRFLDQGRWVSGEVRVVRTASELEACRKVPGYRGGVLVQELVPGSGEGVFLLTDRGRPRVRFAHRRLREKPPWGGVSVLCEAVEPEPELLAKSERLLADLAWTGVAMVEFRRAAQGPAYLMEVNPRLWGSLQLAIDAGVDFPSLLIALSGGVELPPVRARAGSRTRWLLGDVDHLLICLRRRSVRRDLGLGVLDLLRQFARSSCDGTRLEVLRRDDWKPFARELREWLAQASGLTRAARLPMGS